MKIERSFQETVTVLSPIGRIDTTTSRTLEEATRRTVDGGARELLVDLSGTDYISSAGLGVLLVLAKRLRELEGRLVLCGMGQPVRQVFHLAGCMPHFTVETSRTAALSHFATPDAAAVTADAASGRVQP